MLCTWQNWLRPVTRSPLWARRKIRAKFILRMSVVEKIGALTFSHRAVFSNACCRVVRCCYFGEAASAFQKVSRDACYTTWNIRRRYVGFFPRTLVNPLLLPRSTTRAFSSLFCCSSTPTSPMRVAIKEPCTCCSAGSCLGRCRIRI